MNNVSKRLFSRTLRYQPIGSLEFEEWQIKSIGDVMRIGSGRDYKHLHSGDIPVFGTGGIMTYVDNFLYEGETVCIGRKGTIDKPMYFNVLPKYIYYAFRAINWKEYNEASGVPSLSKSTIEKIQINVPSFNEQLKIMTVLSCIDKKMDVERRILSKLKEQKDYLLNKLFI
ncbi:restriction endonuclease subunit S [Pedobacter psychroterrae]|uniref:restriction endonuclease subunit S n=1 Tax=Pedobacter psychroterrae TaxID=2530453 RepID=UPI00197E76DC|nr:restriction endonuclease subunit S [Pedobacter psychroterrae]